MAADRHMRDELEARLPTARARDSDKYPRRDMVALYARHVPGVPSQLEGFGLPALEAMACGTPVVAVGPLSELSDGQARARATWLRLATMEATAGGQHRRASRGQGAARRAGAARAWSRVTAFGWPQARGPACGCFRGARTRGKAPAVDHADAGSRAERRVRPVGPAPAGATRGLGESWATVAYAILRADRGRRRSRRTCLG